MGKNTVAVSNAEVCEGTSAITATKPPNKLLAAIKHCWRVCKRSIISRFGMPNLYIASEENFVKEDEETKSEPEQHRETMTARAPDYESRDHRDQNLTFFRDRFEYASFIDELLEHGSSNDWNYASSNIALNDETIREAHDRVNWASICKYQDVSHELLMEFRDRINIHALYYSKFIKYETVRVFFRQLQRSQQGAPRRPTLTIKRAIRQDHMLRVLRFKQLPPHVLDSIREFL